MDVIQTILSPKNATFATATLVGVVIALGLLGSNPNSQNVVGLGPLSIDTTAIGPFSQAEIKAMWEQWRLDATWSGNGAVSWAPNHVFNYCYNQFTFGGNTINSTDPVLSLFGYSNVTTFTNSFGSGFFVVIVSTNSTNNIQYATLFRVVTTVNGNATTVPNNTVTVPHSYRLSYINVIDNISAGKALF
jgi:hypothetical protein